MPKALSLKTRVYNFVQNNPDIAKKDIVAHFLAENEPKSTIYSHIKSYENGLTSERKLGSGRPVKISTTANIKRVIKMMDHKHGISQRKVARRLGCHQSTVIRILKNETNIRCYKKVKKPKRTEQQQ